MENMHYKKFGVNLIISFITMYLVMFLNVDKPEHIYLSLTRVYMTVLMVTPMAVLMILTMGHMFQNKKLNIIISAFSVLVFILALAALRTQAFITDEQYMKAMIPHHSSAILTSKNANIKIKEVKDLSEGIIQSQEREIEQMKRILENK